MQSLRPWPFYRVVTPRRVFSVSLRFISPAVEQQCHDDHRAVRAAQDWTACCMHLAMQAPGCAAIVLAGTLMPQLWTRELSACSTYTVSMAAVSLLHFLVLLLLHPAMYRTHRETVIVTLRALYMLANVTNGLQTCSTITKWWVVEDLESPLSAFFWRTGLIAMLWQAPAFRLPFWQHLHVQNAATIAHALLLAEAVCDTLPDVSYGPDLVSMGHRVLQALGTAWDLFTFVVTGDATALLDHASQEGSSAVGPQLAAAAAAGSIASLLPPPAAAVDSTSGVSSGGPGSRGACLLVVWCWQFLVGNLLIGAVLYWLEAADRAQWWRKHFSRPQEQPKPSQPPQPPSEEQLQQQEQGAILHAYCWAFLLGGVGLVGLLVAGGSLLALALF